MRGMPPTETSKPAKRFRFSLRTLFWWQLLLVPLCLGALYARLGPNGNFALFVGMLLAAVCYTALFVWWSRDSLDRRQLPVLWAVFHGAIYGALFGFLFWVVAFIPTSIQPLVRLANGDPRYAMVRAQPWGTLEVALGSLGVFVLIVGIAALHFSLQGAATGGVIALARDLLRRPHPARTLNPEL
ncbi:MAG: hypothetical protein L0211_19490 [Planctomycetaceae bacterium]|nr:hypothetical protein [Planctomycetaceae bacterium]